MTTKAILTSSNKSNPTKPATTKATVTKTLTAKATAKKPIQNNQTASATKSKQSDINTSKAKTGTKAASQQSQPKQVPASSPSKTSSNSAAKTTSTTVKPVTSATKETSSALISGNWEIDTLGDATVFPETPPGGIIYRTNQKEADRNIRFYGSVVYKDLDQSKTYNTGDIKVGIIETAVKSTGRTGTFKQQAPGSNQYTFFSDALHGAKAGTSTLTADIWSNNQATADSVVNQAEQSSPAEKTVVPPTVLAKPVDQTVPTENSAAPPATKDSVTGLISGLWNIDVLGDGTVFPNKPPGGVIFRTNQQAADRDLRFDGAIIYKDKDQSKTFNTADLEVGIIRTSVESTGRTGTFRQLASGSNEYAFFADALGGAQAGIATFTVPIW